MFRCECCGAEATEVVHNGIIAVPPQCPSATCGRKQTLRIIPNRCAYANRQVRHGAGGVGSHKPHTTPPSVTQGTRPLNRMQQLPQQQHLLTRHTPLGCVAVADWHTCAAACASCPCCLCLLLSSLHTDHQGAGGPLQHP